MDAGFRTRERLENETGLPVLGIMPTPPQMSWRFGLPHLENSASELSSQIVIAQAETAKAAARLDQVENALTGSRSAEGVSEVLNSALIQGLKQQEALLQRRAAELSTEYGEKHPRMINVRAEIQDIRGRIRSEIGKVVDSLRNDLHAAEAKEQSLRASLNELNAGASELSEAEVELRALQREADANRLLLFRFGRLPKRSSRI